MSNIIKGQRVRSESILEIETLVKSFAPSNEVKLPNASDKENKANSYYFMQQSKLKAEQEALIILEQADMEAEQIITNAKIKAEQDASTILEQAKQKGYTEGYDQGKIKSQHLLDEGKEVLEEAKLKRETMLQQLEPEIVETIISISQKLISEELQFNKTTIQLLIRKLLGDIPYEMSEITIKVPTSQYEYVLENKELIVENYANPSDVTIWQDADLSEGSCIVETPFGSVECNINSGLDEIKKQMRLLCDKG